MNFEWMVSPNHSILRSQITIKDIDHHDSTTNSPGEILADELHDLDISAAELARILHVPTNRITQILTGKRAITADTALRFGQWFSTGPVLWLNLQKAYELRLAEQSSGQESRRTIPTRQAA